MTVLGGKDCEGNAALLISAFSTGDNTFRITLDRETDPAKCTVLLLDENHNLSPCLDAVVTCNTITFANESNSAVALVRIAK